MLGDEKVKGDVNLFETKVFHQVKYIKCIFPTKMRSCKSLFKFEKLYSIANLSSYFRLLNISQILSSFHEDIQMVLH